MQKPSRLPRTVLKYLVATLLIAIPLYPKFPFLRVPGTFVSIRLEDVLIGLSSFLYLIYLFPGFKKFFRNPIYRAITLFLATGLISLISAVLVTQTVVPHIGLLHWVRRIEYFVPFFLGMSLIKKGNKDVEFYFKILLLVLTSVFIYGFGQRYLSWPIVITQNQEYSKGIALLWMEGSHINSTFAGHYDLATFLVLILPIVVCAFTLLEGKFTKIVLALVFLSSIWLLVNTASRISLISYLGSVTISLFLLKKYKIIVLIWIISLVFIGFSSNLQSRYLRLFEVGRDKIQNLLTDFPSVEIYAQDVESFKKINFSPTPTPVPVFEDRSSSIRLNVEWPRALRAFFKNPLLGTGYSSITLATDNDYLRLLGEVGLLGFFSFLLIFAYILIKLFKVFSFGKKFDTIDLAFIVGYTGALPGILLNAFFIDVFEASKFALTFWLVTGIVFSIILNKK